MRRWYRPIEPYKTEYLWVSKLHKLYLEQSGNPKGIPIIHLHGGPGSKSKPDYRRYYNPKKYRIILFDQRGCGKSHPQGETKQNMTWDLVEDMEKIRKHLKIDKWVVTGGSWGSSLALAYAETHPDSISHLIVRSIFLCREWELDELFDSDRFSVVYPDIWEEFSGFIPEKERGNLSKAYEKRVFGTNKKIQKKAIQLLSFWDIIRQQLLPKIKSPDEIMVNRMSFGWKIFFHYFRNKMFFKKNQLLKNIKNIRKISGIIFHGRYDMTCPLQNAWDLYKAWPEAEFSIIADGAHKVSDPGMTDKMIECTDTLTF